MSEDDDLFDDDIDDSVLREVAQLEAQARPATSAKQQNNGGPAVSRGNMQPAVLKPSNVSSRLPNTKILHRATSNGTLGATSVSAAGSTHIAEMGPALQQKDLFGNILPSKASTSNAVASTSKVPPWQATTSSTLSGGTTTDKVRTILIKKWDQTHYAKSGAVRNHATKSKASASKSLKAGGKGKGKGKATTYDEDGGLDDDVEDDDGISDDDEIVGPPAPMKIQPDREACKTFVYPLNKPLRKYQYDIVTKSFYTDTLVALPTGLGKTFLAAVLMLNFYRWFPKGKIIFMAPSRPLVTQQIKACHGIAGIPLQDAVELTGKDPPEKRQEQWDTRRLFYCTPQTVINDLRNKRIDSTDIVCIVVDEAHRAMGGYAYTRVVQYLMKRNPHFRILALTATPGGNAEVVQAVVDNLHIGHIEVRTDESLDIRQYIHKKKIELVVIPIQGELQSISDRFGALMDILLQPLKQRGVFHTAKQNPAHIHAYAFQKASQRAHAAGVGWAITQLTFLGAMSRCIVKLLEQSVSAFNESLRDLQGQAKGKAKELMVHPNYASIVRDTQDIVNGRDFAGHPKMVKLREMVQSHFKQAEQDGSLETTRIMVFCSFREVVEEIVERLNRTEGIRATRLVGQGTDAKGKKGLAQKQQNEVLAKFKGGTYNVLVATSIGEEGLDIGELDLIICYEAPKSSIRTLQRAGRTGRARDGKVIVLMTEGIEESNWQTANDNYKGVENAIVSGKLFELYADCKRLVPDDIRPAPDKRVVDVEPFDPEKMGVSSRRTSKKRVREEGDKLDLFESGFQKASGRRIRPKADDMDGEQDTRSSDANPMYIADGDGTLSVAEQSELARCKQIPSIQAAQSAHQRLTKLAPQAARRGLLQTYTGMSRFNSTMSRSTTLVKIFEAGRLMSADPARYKEWEQNTYPHFRNSNVNWWADSKVGTGRDSSFKSMRVLPQDRTNYSPSCLISASDKAQDNLPQDGLENAEDKHFQITNNVRSSRAPESDDDDDLPDLPTIARNTTKDIKVGKIVARAKPRLSSSPALSRQSLEAKSTSKAASTGKDVVVIDLDGDDDVDDVHQSDRSKQPRNWSSPRQRKAASPRSQDRASGSGPRPPSPGLAAIPQLSEADLPSPLVAQQSSALRVIDVHEDDSPLVPLRRKAVKRIIADDESSSPNKVARITGPVPANDVKHNATQVSAQVIRRKLVRASDMPEAKTSEVKMGQPRKRKAKLLPGDACPFFDLRAVNSDDPDSLTDSDGDDEGPPETHGDRRFVASDGMASDPADMSAFYRESLMSQANHRFQHDVKRPGAYKMENRARRRRSIVRSADNSPGDASQWQFGSFVVDDDDDIIYEDEGDDLSIADKFTSET